MIVLLFVSIANTTSQNPKYRLLLQMQSIRSDLTEFASCVSQDTASAVNTIAQDAVYKLNKIDEAFGKERPSEAEQEAIYRVGLREVYLTPLLPELCGDDDDEQILTSREAEFRVFDEHQVASFLASFNIEDVTESIAELLQHQEALREMFEALVPVEVSYKTFWERFYFRCDPHRIQEAWDFQEKIEARERQAHVQTVKGIITAPVKIITAPAKIIATPVTMVAGHVLPALKTGIVSLVQPGMNILFSSPSVHPQVAEEDLSNLQKAVTSSNERIGSLRMSLDTAQKQLQAKEATSRELELQLNSAKAALKTKESRIQILQDKIREISVPMDSTSNTAESTSEEFSTNREDDDGDAYVVKETQAAPTTEKKAVAVEDGSGTLDSSGRSTESTRTGGTLLAEPQSEELYVDADIDLFIW